MIVAPFVIDHLILMLDLANGAMVCSPSFIATLTHPLWITCIVSGVLMLVVTHWRRKRDTRDTGEE